LSVSPCVTAGPSHPRLQSDFKKVKRRCLQLEG
jgi:hypothetical protein